MTPADQGALWNAVCHGEPGFFPQVAGLEAADLFLDPPGFCTVPYGKGTGKSAHRALAVSRPTAHSALRNLSAVATLAAALRYGPIPKFRGVRQPGGEKRITSEMYLMLVKKYSPAATATQRESPPQPVRHSCDAPSSTAAPTAHRARGLPRATPTFDPNAALHAHIRIAKRLQRTTPHGVHPRPRMSKKPSLNPPRLVHEHFS